MSKSEKKDSKYPFPELLRSHKECLQAVDWILINHIDKFDQLQQNRRLDWVNYATDMLNSIRKRAFQLKLNDLEGIGILERCARFHIFCAHAFAGIPEPHFVAKFNYDSLDKCLCTLHELYYDHSLRGIHCKNEAEFTCYYLLHFANCERNVLNLPVEIRKSEAVQFALKVKSATENRNHVEFFKLIREADYLQACLLHRTFYPVRERVIGYYPSVYSVRRLEYNVVKIPIESLMSELAFDCSTELESYLKYYGAQFNPVHALFGRSCRKGAGPKPQLGPSAIVESKRADLKLSEVISGGEGPLRPDDIVKQPSLQVLLGSDEDLVEKWTELIKDAEYIWKSVFYHVLSDLIEDTCTKLFYPDGEPEYVYEDVEEAEISKSVCVEEPVAQCSKEDLEQEKVKKTESSKKEKLSRSSVSESTLTEFRLSSKAKPFLESTSSTKSDQIEVTTSQLSRTPDTVPKESRISEPNPAIPVLTAREFKTKLFKALLKYGENEEDLRRVYPTAFTEIDAEREAARLEQEASILHDESALVVSDQEDDTK